MLVASFLANFANYGGKFGGYAPAGGQDDEEEQRGYAPAIPASQSGSGLIVPPASALLAPARQVASSLMVPRGPAMFGGGREDGGDVSPYEDYLVGESGPEILRAPPGGGTIIPNDQIGGGEAPAIGSTEDLEARAAQPRMSASAPPVGSTEDLESRIAPPHPYAPVAAPLRPQWKGDDAYHAAGGHDYAPAEPHGWAKFGHFLAGLTPQTDQAFNRAPKDLALDNYKNAVSEFESPLGEEQKRATTEETQARTDALRNPPPKQGLTPEELFMHDALHGSNGGPKNDASGKPYDYLSAHAAWKQSEQDVKPDKTQNAEDQFVDEYRTKNPKATIAEAQRAYEQNKSIKDESAKNDARSDRSYQFHAGRIDKLATPVEQRAERIARLEDTLNQNSPQADALIAPELLTVMAGGQGSGLRMNEAEIARVIGGRDKWESIKSKLEEWQLDPKKPFAFQPEQREEIRKLFATIRERVTNKMQVLEEARGQLVDSDDPHDHRKIVTDLQKKLDAVDSGKEGDNAGTQVYQGHTYDKQKDGSWKLRP
jgi:hypothetical protein